MSEGLVLRGVTQRIGDCTALDGVDLTLRPGTVHALLGENGAGKSTLLRVASGLVRPVAGSVSVDGKALRVGSAREALHAGVGVVHQHFMLVEPLTVAQNVVLGDEPRSGPLGLWLDAPAARERVRAVCDRYGFSLDPDAVVEKLSVGERQQVELARVLARGARWLLLDEPTAVLSPREVRTLLGVLRSLASAGAGVLLVTHKLDEVWSVADELTMLRRGKRVLHGLRAALSEREVTEALVGGAAPEPASESAHAKGEVVLEVRGARAPGLEGVSVSVRAGEVLGIAGVEGNGQRVLTQGIAGLGAWAQGSVWLAGKELTGLSVRARRLAGLGYVPEDREGAGLLSALSVWENIALGDPALGTVKRWLARDALRERARELCARFGVEPPEPETPVRSLSGGNAQKVLLGRELARSVKALVVSQPTRGVDLGAAMRLRAALRECAASGVAVLLVSSELEELRQLSDRVLVLHRGHVAGELPVREATDEALGPLMVGAAGAA